MLWYYGVMLMPLCVGIVLVLVLVLVQVLEATVLVLMYISVRVYCLALLSDAACLLYIKYLFIKGMSCKDIYDDMLVPSYNVVKNWGIARSLIWGGIKVFEEV